MSKRTAYRNAIRRYLAMRKLFAHSNRDAWHEYQCRQWEHNLVPTQWTPELQR